MSYDRETRKKRIVTKKRKARDPVAKELGSAAFRQRVLKEEKKQKRKLTDGQIIRMYCDLLEEEDNEPE